MFRLCRLIFNYVEKLRLLSWFYFNTRTDWLWMKGLWIWVWVLWCLQIYFKNEKYPSMRRVIPEEMKDSRMRSLMVLLDCYLISMVVFYLLFWNCDLSAFSMVEVLIVESTYPFLDESHTWMMWDLVNLFFIDKKRLSAIWLCREWS